MREYRDADLAKSLADETGAPPTQHLGDKRTGQAAIAAAAAAAEHYLDISFIELARAAANPVARVIFGDRFPQGSGFMISDRLFLTNGHVVPNAGAAANFFAEFNFELDHLGRPKDVSVFYLDPDTLFFTSDETQLDFTVVAMGDRVLGTHDLADFGYCPLFDESDAHHLGDLANVIQHPDGKHKQIVLRENRLISKFDKVLHYVANTMQGSSGSPVFNDNWEVIAMHHWSRPHIETSWPDGRPVPEWAREGVRIGPILKTLREHWHTFSEAQQRLLDDVFRPDLRQPSGLNS